MNRKKDLELLSEVYAEAMGYAGGRGSVNTQPGAGGTGDYDDSTGQITQRAEDQNPLENDEGEEESPQERSARQASKHGYARKHADEKGNVIMTGDKGTIKIDTDGQINGLPASQFFKGQSSTGDQAGEAEEDSPYGTHTFPNTGPNSGEGQWNPTGQEDEEDDNAFPTDLSYFDSDEKDDDNPKVSGIKYFNPKTGRTSDEDESCGSHSDEEMGHEDESYEDAKEDGLHHPEKADLDDDDDISEYELKKGKAIQKAMSKESYSSKGDRAMTQLMENYEKVIQNGRQIL